MFEGPCLRQCLLKCHVSFLFVVAMSSCGNLGPGIDWLVPSTPEGVTQRDWEDWGDEGPDDFVDAEPYEGQNGFRHRHPYWA